MHATLRFSKGYVLVKKGDNRDPNHVVVFAASWERGRISAFAGMHRPEVCLGLLDTQVLSQRMTQLPNVTGEMGGDWEIFSFQRRQGRFFVARKVWDEREMRVANVAMGPRERLQAAFHLERLLGRRLVLILLEGPRSEAEALQLAGGTMTRIFSSHVEGE